MFSASALLLALAAIQDPILDPTSWTSLSGEFGLDVDPSRPDGGGSAAYRLVRGRDAVWSGERSFTLWGAAVTNAGTVLGYAYTEGIRSAKGELQLIRIGIDGQASVLDAKPRRSPASPGGSPGPVALDIVVEEEADHGMIGIQNAQPWYVRLSNGELLPPFRVRSSPSRPARRRSPDPYSEPPLITLEALGTFTFGGGHAAVDPSDVSNGESKSKGVGDPEGAQKPIVPDSKAHPILGRLSAVEVDLAGRVYAMETSTYHIHVFDASGLPLWTCRPDPSDFEHDFRLGSLAVGPKGSVYATDLAERRDQGQPLRFLVYGPNGARRGWESLGFDTIDESWRFKPEGGERWVVGYRALFLAGSDGRLRRRIDRQPDRNWIRYPVDLAVAPDGSVALMTSSTSSRGKGEFAVHLYDAEGTPLRSFELPPDVRPWHPALAWTGRWVVVARERGRFLLIDTVSGRRARYEPSWISAGSSGPDPFLVGPGRELWLVDREARFIRRFSLPGD